MEEVAKKFNKTCKHFYKSMQKEYPNEKTIGIILHTFGVMKTFDKNKPISFFIERVLCYDEMIKARNPYIVDQFIQDNPGYNWLRDGKLDKMMKDTTVEARDTQNFIWEQISILYELACIFKDSKILKT